MRGVGRLLDLLNKVVVEGKDDRGGVSFPLPDGLRGAQ
jgi:hypothetical protein